MKAGSYQRHLGQWTKNPALRADLNDLLTIPAPDAHWLDLIESIHFGE
jgi:hypothetical protein